MGIKKEEYGKEEVKLWPELGGGYKKAVIYSKESKIHWIEIVAANGKELCCINSISIQKLLESLNGKELAGGGKLNLKVE